MMHRVCMLALLAMATTWAAPVRVLILSGRNNHDWRTTTPRLRQILDRAGGFDVRVTEEPSGLNAAALAGYEVLVADYNGPRWGAAAEKAIEDAVRGGTGLVVVHGASYAFGSMEILGDRHVKTGKHEAPWPAWAEMTGASWSDDAPKSGHAPRHIFEVKIAKADHAITQGLANFQTSDELYHSLRMQPGSTVLATAFDDPAIGGTGKDEPILWTRAFGKGRVFHTVLGHDVAAMSEDGFAKTFARGTEWAARGVIAAREASKPGIRVLVVTGGHSHETSFYTMLESIPGLNIEVDPHPAAYGGKLDRYQVLVLYDMVQTLDEQRRKNLQAFVESGGKGVVAIHHAIADFNDWRWWWEDVIGGRYLLKAENGAPASTYKHDDELRVRKVSDHPIVRGLPEMHFFDETYKLMWISPKAQVLLRTDHPNSDGPVAWVSPYEKARVVYIQLGHDHTAHEYEPYRQLVRQAIEWAAGASVAR